MVTPWRGLSRQKPIWEQEIRRHIPRAESRVATKVLFGPSGHAYVYLIYGVHYCLNISAEEEGTAGCVLIRAVEPVSGISQPTNGPGKLTKAMDITLAQNDCDLTSGPITVLKDRTSEDPWPIAVSPRIGITKSVDLPLRFHVSGNRFVSRG